MKFVIEKKEILPKLTTICSISPAISTKPITECILMDLVDDDLTLTSTNIIQTLTTKIEVVGETNGKYCFKAKSILSYIKAMPEGLIVFSCENGIMTIKCQKVKFTINSLGDLNEFPEFPVLDNIATFETNGNIMQALNKVRVSTAKDQMKEILTGVLLEVVDNVLSMVATDGMSLMLYRASKECANFSVIIPNEALNVLSNCITDANECTFTFGERLFKFENEQYTMFSKWIIGKYPNYEAIIPKNQTNTLIVNKTELIQSLNRVAIVSSLTTKIVKLKVDKNVLTISASGDISNAEDIIEIENNGDCISLVIPCNFVNVLKQFDSEMVKIVLNGNSKPLTIYETESDKNITGLQMVLRES